MGWRDKSNPRPRTIVCKLSNYKDKDDILRKSNLLRGSYIFISEDYSPDTVRIRKVLFKQAKAERANGNFAKVVYKRLIVQKNRHDKAADGDDATEGELIES